MLTKCIYEGHWFRVSTTFAKMLSDNCVGVRVFPFLQESILGAL